METLQTSGEGGSSCMCGALHPEQGLGASFANSILHLLQAAMAPPHAMLLLGAAASQPHSKAGVNAQFIPQA